MINIFKNSFKKGIVTKPIVFSDTEIETLGKELKTLVYNKFKRSFHIREVDTGSCGACESEIIAATNPIYDIQRFGIDFVASPRHADALLVTGPVSKNMELALKRTFEAMPKPSFVITLGDCALNGGQFSDSYYTLGGVKNVLPVAFHIPGCPPKPIDIIRYLILFLKK
ncbi:MAG: NADH-quinone oxidoreductase subunit B family protein [Elusimicrobia bacterium]|nr:NADH-quinone oxidoreductase subunit B family protein [Candidatus Liberimonas magnetica]